MADPSMTGRPPAGPSCPWCSAPLPGVDAESCPACGARLVGDEDAEIPGVTSVSPDLLAASASPRAVKRTFGALLVRDAGEIPPPSEAELPALAPPGAEVRLEMLRLALDARLSGLQAEAKALAAEGHRGIVETRPAGPAAAAGPSADEAAPGESPAAGPQASSEPPAAEPPAGASGAPGA